MLKNSWKLLCVLLLVYVVIASYLTPLEPGITRVDTSFLSTEIYDLDIEGYNTHFDSEENTAFLTSADSSAVILPVSVYSNSPSKLQVQVQIPDTFNTDLPHLYVQNDKDGVLFYPTIALPSAVQLDANFVNEGWKESWRKWGVDEGFNFPFQNILYETIRNLHFHVTMWFATMALFALSFGYSIVTLGKKDSLLSDKKASLAVNTGMLFTVLGLVTGAIWAKYTWGAWWVNDPKLNGAAVSALVYLAYMILRKSVEDPEKRMRLSAVYNIFAFVMFIVFIQVLPRFTDSLHPGNGGNPAFSSYDLDSSLRAVFYPAVLGFILLGFWIWQLKVRAYQLFVKHEDI